MKKVEEVFIILNALCGFIQVLLAFFVKPIGYWLYPIIPIVGIFGGYKYVHDSQLKLYEKQIVILLVLFLINVVFFILGEITFLYNPMDSFTIGCMLLCMIPFIWWNFFEFAKMLARYRTST